MVFNWQQVFVALGGEAILLAAIGWLLKAIISQGLTRDVERFKISLKADADAQIEHLKASLQILALEHQVRFAKLHEKQAEVIATLYKQLKETHWAARSFLYGDSGDIQKERFANERIVELYSLIETHRLYLPAAVCVSVEAIVGKLGKAHGFVKVYGHIADPTPEMREKQLEVIKQVCDALETEIPALTSLLESDFRKLLGVKED